MAPGQVLGTEEASCTEAPRTGSGTGGCSAEGSAALLPGHWLLAFSHICVPSLHCHPLYMARMGSWGSLTCEKFNRGAGIKLRSSRSKPINTD